MQKNPYIKIKVSPEMKQLALQRKNQFIKDPDINCIISIIENQLNRLKLSRMILINPFMQNKSPDFSLSDAEFISHCVDISNFAMMLADKIKSKKVSGVMIK